jgi:hypothetical protein
MTEAALGQPPMMPSASPGDSLMRTPTLAQPATDLRRRVARLLLLRTLVVSVVLGLSLWLLLRSESSLHGAVWLQSGIIALTYLSHSASSLASSPGAQM